jgi:maltose alpha-D-glucosyltransferase/alpha-amylase
MDPVFGYQSINVEAQQEDSSSLLNWMRNMIALRKLFQVFGRGTMEILHPDNRKILAYLRCYGEDRILCVANLSRFAQPVELDLSRYAGMSPTEMLGYVEFPKIGRTPYTLTLGPYGFLWFELHGKPESAVAGASAENVEPTLVLPPSDPWESLFQNESKTAWVTHALQDFLPQQRWFGRKTEVIHAVHITDWGRVPESSAAIVIAEIEFMEGSVDSYCLPVSLALGEAAARLQAEDPTAVLCSVVVGDKPGVLYDSTYDEACLAFLCDSPENRAVWNLHRRWTSLRSYRKPRAGITFTESKEQSNSSVLFEIAIPKYSADQSRASPIATGLPTEQRRRRHPPYAGSIEYARPGTYARCNASGICGNQETDGTV